MESDTPYPKSLRLSTTKRLRFMNEQIQTQPSEPSDETQPSGTDIEMLPSEASVKRPQLETIDDSKQPSDSDSDDSLLGYDPNLKIAASKQPSDSDSDDSLLGYDPNFERVASVVKRQRIESSSTSESSDETQPSGTDIEMLPSEASVKRPQLETIDDSKQPSDSGSDHSEIQPSGTDIEMLPSKASVKGQRIESSSTSETSNESQFSDTESELESSDDEQDWSSDNEKETSSLKKCIAINPFAIEMLAEIFAELLLKFIETNNAKLGIISTDKSASNSKDSICSNLMGTSESFANMPAIKDIFLELLYCTNDTLYQMEDDNLNMDAFDSNKQFKSDFLDNIMISQEAFCGLFANKRLNNNFDKTAYRYSTSTLLELIYGNIEMNSEEVKCHATELLGGFIDADGSISLDSCISSGWKDGENNSSRAVANYKIKGNEATLQEIKEYHALHPTREHLGHAPIINLTISCVCGIRSSPFAIALAFYLNSAYGFHRGRGVILWERTDDSLFVTGYVSNGNNIQFRADSTNGHQSELESAKIDLSKRLTDGMIIKKAEMQNVSLNFPQAKHCLGNTLSKLRQEIPVQTPAERQAIEAVRRKMLVTDKELKIARKKICGDGVVPEQVQKYKEALLELNNLKIIESLPKGCIHTNNILVYATGMLMGDGGISLQRVQIAQKNYSFNTAFAEVLRQYIGGQFWIGEGKIQTNSTLQTMMFLLAIGFHSSHRREQVIVSLLHNLIFRSRKSVTGMKIDQDFLSKEITKKWKLMKEDKQSEHRANVKKWMKNESRDREYDESNGFVCKDEIDSTLKVLRKVLDKLYSQMQGSIMSKEILYILSLQ